MNILDLNEIKSKEAVDAEKPDKQTTEEIASFDIASFDAESRRLDNQGKKQDIAAREKYASYIFILICVWLTAMLIVVILAGFGKKYGWFVLGDYVLISLITTTTASVVGVFVIVANYLFNGRNESKR